MSTGSADYSISCGWGRVVGTMMANVCTASPVIPESNSRMCKMIIMATWRWWTSIPTEPLWGTLGPNQLRSTQSDFHTCAATATNGSKSQSPLLPRVLKNPYHWSIVDNAKCFYYNAFAFGFLKRLHALSTVGSQSLASCCSIGWRRLGTNRGEVIALPQGTG